MLFIEMEGGGIGQPRIFTLLYFKTYLLKITTNLPEFLQLCNNNTEILSQIRSAVALGLNDIILLNFLILEE